jgi:hypothetical protein
MRWKPRTVDTWVGLARIVYIYTVYDRVFDDFPAKKYCIYTVYMWSWPSCKGSCGSWVLSYWFNLVWIIVESYHNLIPRGWFVFRCVAGVAILLKQIHLQTARSALHCLSSVHNLLAIEGLHNCTERAAS